MIDSNDLKIRKVDWKIQLMEIKSWQMVYMAIITYMAFFREFMDQHSKVPRVPLIGLTYIRIINTGTSEY